MQGIESARTPWGPLAVVAAALSTAPGLALGGGRPGYDATAASVGATTFKTHCSSCHGPTGHGDGPLSDTLRVAPPDLTRLAKRNGGKYPFDKVYRTIDGREPVKGHGGAGMPVWGDAFLTPDQGYSQEKVKEKITQLVHYLASIQDEK